jgi:hypothetical protein
MFTGADAWAITESVSTAVSAGVLLLGVYFAQRYGRRANTTLKARLFERAGGGIALEVQLEVNAVGLKAVRVVQSDGQTPMLTIYNVIDDGLRFQYPIQDQRRIESLTGQYAGPGETVRCTELCHLLPPEPDQVGWQIEFSFDARRPIARWDFISWTETAFVPLDGSMVREDDYDREQDESAITAGQEVRVSTGQTPGADPS